ncbi:Protein of uncharacterised function (DUF3304) [Acinetobacter baumannii]|uniref:DUF3304 domain-containing protein n=1 Tax=Acinetobacter baumannii TaxID=470 RepID=UPI000DE783C9|nr:DUF3304 domain-containing protein [Acinetobacter baumannii]MDC4839769.1 DUF3304 domain-containing protein [Acinetobacter baumannii]SSI88241.1 Protein of uncharacterised function (DUF3304) [Acinetobacter baumannii]SSO29319.1 Protein of uncharacterised function (DUF3304) [Acinetobacter baumannii]SSP07527.1 Protein of uncharacterised function (DUF3304) [Acinetobacter baumannii]HEO1798009.1 DUF3304 domain-containing protein [Acinetobacter baumannii]
MKNIFKLMLSAAVLPLMVACQAETVDLTFLVYNYSTYGMADISVNGKGHTNSGAADRLGSIGEAGTACCVHLIANSDTADVSFYTDRGDGYKQYHIKVPVENLKDTPRSYAVLHYFPNNTGVIEVSMRRPSFRKDLFDKALGNKAKNIQLDSPTMWRTIPENEAARIQFPD